MSRVSVLLLWFTASVVAESNLGAPVVGMARDTYSHLRPVYGVAA